MPICRTSLFTRPLTELFLPYGNLLKRPQPISDRLLFDLTNECCQLHHVTQVVYIIRAVEWERLVEIWRTRVVCALNCFCVWPCRF